MGDVMAKIQKLRSARPSGGGNQGLRNIFMGFENGDNPLRLVSEFVEVRTHYIAPSPKNKTRGLCNQDSFKGEDSVPYVVNCSDWDIGKEAPTKEQTCVVCKLHKLAEEAMTQNLESQEEKFLKNLLSETRVRTSLKWNVIDRNNSELTKVDNGVESQVLGYKIATFGMEAWNGIEGIFTQVGFDITDPERGIDVNVIKGHNGTRVCYSAKTILDGLSIKQTPLTEEERALELHDLKRICGKMTPQEKIMDNLHGDLRDLLEVNEDDDEFEEEEEVAVTSLSEDEEYDDEFEEAEEVISVKKKSRKTKSE